MKLKNKLAALSTLLMFQSFGVVNAAPIDKEIAVMAAEQDRSGEQIETFDPDSLEVNKTKTPKEIKDEEKRLEKEREEARKKIKEERKKSRDELNGKTPISKNPAPPVRVPENNYNAAPPQNTEPVKEIPATVENNPPVENPAAENKNATSEESADDEESHAAPVAAKNPVENYASFNEIVQAVKFTPLYIPKKTGYKITSISTVNKNIAEIRYVRNWEPNVSLRVRTYYRPNDEKLKDISGIQGVKWRTYTAEGTKVYISKVSANKQVAAWAVGNYTFSAYAENISFAAFYSLVTDELVDLTQHYYLIN